MPISPKVRKSEYVRTSVMVPAYVVEALKRKAAEGNRPLSREIRAALETYVKETR